jgi:hypothetical protein
MQSSAKYPWSVKRIAKSPFMKGKSASEALKLAKQKEKDYNSGKSIGFTFESSLKSMGRIKRSHGKYELGDKYK